MLIPSFNPGLSSPTRRGLMWAVAGCGVLALTSSGPFQRWLPRRLDGTFLQAWKSDLDLPRSAWAERIHLFATLDCRHLILQWVSFGQEYGLSDPLLLDILDFALAAGVRVTFGLPYDGGYWQMLASGDRAKRAAFLDRVGTEGVAFLEAARHSNHPAFAGYYIPYEIDQYSWADPADRDLLAGYLRRISTAARGPGVLSISTFRSGIPTTATLEGLWERILTSVPLKVMVQDGVGVFGMANYARLAPLFATLRRRGADFDVIVELFTEKPSGRTDGTTFAADPATIGRLQAQLAVAAGTGARRLIGFAVHPYMTDGMPGAADLRRNYLRALSAGA